MFLVICVYSDAFQRFRIWQVKAAISCFNYIRRGCKASVVLRNQIDDCHNNHHGKDQPFSYIHLLHIPETLGMRFVTFLIQFHFILSTTQRLANICAMLHDEGYMALRLIYLVSEDWMLKPCFVTKAR